MKIIVSAVLALLANGVVAADESATTFCARLAPQIGLKPTGNPALWQGHLVSPLKGALVGGSGQIGFQVEPSDASIESDYAALRDACVIEMGAFRCVVDRPMWLTVSSNKGDARVEAKAGETALIETRGMRVRCTDGVAGS
jgi:hypothetical protein